VIEQINEQFEDACVDQPIRVFYTNDQPQALAAMEFCDVLLVNSLEDGMNLVAKEWAVVADGERPGVLVVSDTAGVASDAADSALLITPLDVEGTAAAMAAALKMPLAERTARRARLLARVSGWTARDWLAAQLADLGLPSVLR
jgi:trehalose 6-phosphate synthase